MASTVTNSFDADKLHQPIVVAVKRVPRIPLGKDNLKVLDNYCLHNYTIGAKLVPIFAGVCTAGIGLAYNDSFPPPPPPQPN